MVTEIQPSVIRSSDGFEVAFLGGEYVTYRERDHVMRFHKDRGLTIFRYYLRNVPKWEPPFDGEDVSPEKQAEIRQRIIAAATFQGDRFETDMDSPSAGVPEGSRIPGGNVYRIVHRKSSSGQPPPGEASR